MNGQALDLFGPGRYTLETQNIPLLKKFTNIPTDGKTPFHCEVYFINIEKAISEKISELKSSGDKSQLISEITNLISERNKKCKLLK